MALLPRVHLFAVFSLFCIHVSRPWDAEESFDALTGWVQVIRGPRPLSVRWPRVGQQQQQIAQQNQKPVQVRIPQNQVKTSGVRPFVDPSVKLAAAKERAVKLETALAAMEGVEGPEVESVRAAHKRARGSPGCSESFFVRAASHLKELVGHKTSRHFSEHRDVQEAVGGIEGPVSSLPVQEDWA